MRFERFGIVTYILEEKKIQEQKKILKTNENRISVINYNSWEVGRDRI